MSQLFFLFSAQTVTVAFSSKGRRSRVQLQRDPFSFIGQHLAVRERERERDGARVSASRLPRQQPAAGLLHAALVLQPALVHHRCFAFFSLSLSHFKRLYSLLHTSFYHVSLFLFYFFSFGLHSGFGEAANIQRWTETALLNLFLCWPTSSALARPHGTTLKVL